jgi:N-ethylmaleimide reductase
MSTPAIARAVAAVLAGGFDRDTAEAWLEQGKADLIALREQVYSQSRPAGAVSLARPAQCRRSVHLLWWRCQGYTDYPTLAQERGEQPKPCVDDRWR